MGKFADDVADVGDGHYFIILPVDCLPLNTRTVLEDPLYECLVTKSIIFRASMIIGLRAVPRPTSAVATDI